MDQWLDKGKADVAEFLHCIQWPLAPPEPQSVEPIWQALFANKRFGP